MAVRSSNPAPAEQIEAAPTPVARHWRKALSAGIGLVVILFVLWKLPDVYFADWEKHVAKDQKIAPHELLKLKNDFRGTLATAFGGAALLVGLFFTWRNIKTAEQNIHFTQEAATRNLEVAQEAQFTDRFTKAIEQLGKTDKPGEDNLFLRLGGIYALARIASDSEKDYWPVIEVLTAYVRENRKRAPDSPPEDRSPDESRHSEVESVTLPADIKAILTVLKRRERSFGRGEPHGIDLSHTDLRGADLAGAILDGAVLVGTDLQHATLEKTSLKKAELTNARLRHCVLDETDLTEANLQHAELGGRMSVGTCLEWSDLSEANLKFASFGNVNLRNAFLTGANLEYAAFIECDFTGAHFDGANLQNTRFDDHTVGLTPQQLMTADISETKLPPEVERALRERRGA